MGMGGTAISALSTVKLTAHLGIHASFLIVAAVLAVYGMTAAVVLRDAPDRKVSAEPALARLGSTLRLRVTWQASALYAVGFGGFVAFSVYLPVYLKNAYLLSPADAANKMAGFVLLAVVMRPVGGWLSDRFAPTAVLTGAFAVVAAGAIGQSLTPALAPAGTIAFLGLAAALGTAAGAVFALVAQRQFERAPQVPRRGIGQHRPDSVDHMQPRCAGVGQRGAEQFQAGPVPPEQRTAPVRRGGGELAEHSDVIGQFARCELEAGHPVGGGECQ